MIDTSKYFNFTDQDIYHPSTITLNSKNLISKRKMINKLQEHKS